jgi:hypothetical protein
MPVDLPDSRDQVHPCRPTISCTADIVAPGRFELESGGLASSASGGPRVLAVPFLLKQGLTHFLELQVGSNGQTQIDSAPRVHYLDNVFAGPKLHLLDQAGLWPSLAFSAQVSLPTFAADGYVRRDDVFVTGFASKDIGFVHADWNVGAMMWGVDASPTKQFFTALALSPTLPYPFGISVEGYYFSDDAPVAPRDGGFRAYLGLSPRSWLAFDIGGDAGFFPSTRAFSLFAGVTMIPVVFWRPAEEASR